MSYPGHPRPTVVPTSGSAVVSLIFGLLGFSAACCWPLVIFSAVGVITGHAALSETKSGARSGHGIAVAGLMLSYFSVIPALIVIVLTLMGMGIEGLDGGTK